MSAPTTELVRSTLVASLGLTAESDLGLQQELLSVHLTNHWIEGPGPTIVVPRWGEHSSWELSFVGPGGAYSIVHVALASERVDALVVLAAERLEQLGEPVPELTVLATELLMYGRARIHREQAELPEGQPCS